MRLGAVNCGPQVPNLEIERWTICSSLLSNLLRDEGLTRGGIKKAVGEKCVGVCTCRGQVPPSLHPRPALLVAVLRVFVCVIAQDYRPQGHNLSQNPAPPPLGYIENTHTLSPTQKQVGHTQTMIRKAYL